MKKTLFFVFSLCLTLCYSQKNTNYTKQVNSSQFQVDLSAGIAAPSSTFSDNSFAGDGSFFELAGTFYFSNMGIGVSIGQNSFPTKGKLDEFTSLQEYPISTSTEKWKSLFYGIGPDYRINLNEFDIILSARGGISSTQPISLNGNFIQESADPAVPTINVPVYNFENTETIQSGFYSAGIKLAYNISPNFSFFIRSNYSSSSSDKIAVKEGRKQFSDINKDGIINEEDISRQQDIEFITASKTIKPQSLNYGFGLTWKTGNKTKIRKPMQDVKTLNEEQKTKVEVRGWNPVKKSKITKNKGTVTFTNPIKEIKKQQRKIIQTSPKNNRSFNDFKQLNEFTWRVVGERLMQPKYGITIEKVNRNQQISRTYYGTSSKVNISSKKIFKEQPEDGQYRWKVTETTTGISSNYSFFNFTNCEIDFSISNEEIECLGYVGEDRKYKICFDATYSSPNGDLTYLNALSGLSVYDQTYATLSYTLVSPNPTLVTQIGTSTSTISYCFEVTVSSGVTSIGFGLQGDDLDPSPIVCQPGVSAIFDELPDCICDECEEIELTFDNFNITPNAGTGNQFNFNGNINVNVPIYGIEFQIQSYSYSASPSACTEGVSSVEESGMILLPATTINGSSTLQLFNESISGSANSNDNASKAVKYTSNSALTGAIPVNLTIGLPGPISGLDPSCCTIEHEVCIIVRVFYDEGNCKSCVFTHCFEFNNQ